MKTRIIEASERDICDGSNGACLECGAFRCGGCEPDMRKGTCESCGAAAVYGLEELLLMGALDLVDDDCAE